MLSRVADNLYWMSRYLERAEFTARVIEVNLGMMLDRSSLATTVRWQRMLRSLNMPESLIEAVGDDAYAAVDRITFDTGIESSIHACISIARENTRQVRDQVSNEMFEQLNAMYFNVRKTRLDQIWNYQPDEFYRSLRRGSHLFQGLTDSSIIHGQEWLFIQLGRFMERAVMTARLVECYAAPIEAGDELEGFEATHYLTWVEMLRCCSAFEPYLETYRGGVRAESAIEFVLLDATLPRSIRYATDMIQHALGSISRLTASRRAADVDRLVGRLHASLNFARVDEIVAGGLDKFLNRIHVQVAEIHSALYRVYIAYPVEEVTL